MRNLIRWLGLLNAALWWGGTLFFTLVVAPGVFSPQMRLLFSAPFSVGYIAQTLLERFFYFSCCCAFLGLLLAVAEWGVLGRRFPKWFWGLLTALLAFYVASELWLFPMMRNLHETKYFGHSAPQRQRAARTFGAWHGVSQLGNLVALAGLTVYLGSLAVPRVGDDSSQKKSKTSC